ncbi:MAG: hypothetical protein AAFX90_05050 [Pseudomonadota bacterium]
MRSRFLLTLLISLTWCVSADADTDFEEKCLFPGIENTEESPLDWQKIRFLEELDFCLLAKAKQLADPDKLVQWMGENGFRMSRPIPYSRNIMKTSYHYDGEGILVGGSIRKEDFKWNIHPLRTFSAYSLSSGILLKDDGDPISAHSVLNTK